LICRLRSKRVLKSGGKVIVGIIDKNSFLGKFYLKQKKRGHRYYKAANFFSTQEIIKWLEKHNFRGITTFQIIFQPLDKIKKIEQPKKGGRGRRICSDMRQKIKLLIFLATFILPLNCRNIFADTYTYCKAKVLAIGGGEEKKDVRIENIFLEILSGRHKNKIVAAKNYLWDEKNYNTYLERNSVVVVRIDDNEKGEIENVFVIGYVRDKFLLLLILIFGAVLCLVCGWKGARAFISIFINIFLLLKVLIPLIRCGYPPLITCILVALAGTVITLFMILGINRKFFASLCGISAGILFAGIATLIFLELGKISGIFIEGSRMLVMAARSLSGWNISDFRGLVAGGTIIASLGAVIDVVIDIVAGMDSVIMSKPDIDGRQLYNSGLNIGRDILGGMLGSLLFVFVSTNLVMIAVYNILHIPFLRVINWEFFAVFLVQAFVSSMSFVVSIPVTVSLSSRILKDRHV